MKKINRLFRILTSPWRSFPAFFIIGAQKSATSSLYNFITQHPKISCAEKKEIHYYDLAYEKGAYWYKSHFPFKKKGAISGESTPSLLRLKNSLELLKKDIPNIKIIAIFRDPIERTISHYFHNLRKGRENRNFIDAISSAESVLFGDIDLNIKNRASPLQFSYLSRSMYGRQLSYLNQIFHKEQLLLLKYSDVISIECETRQKIFQFLGVEDFYIKSMSFKNKGTNTGNQKIGINEIAFIEEKIKADRKLFLEKVGWDGF